MVKLIKLFCLILFVVYSAIADASTDNYLQQFVQTVKLQCKPTIKPLPNLKLLKLPIPTVLHAKLFSALIVTPLSANKTLTAHILPTVPIPIHYMVAKQLADMLHNKNELDLLSKEGKISVDTNTNVLWIHDHQSKIDQIKKMIRTYDQPLSQIYIKAKIINIDEDYVRSLGIAFTSAALNTQPDTLESLTIPITKLGSNIWLEATLDALEKNGHARLISNPQIITLDRQSATIEAGQEIPYQQSTDNNGGTAVEFKKAVLSLQVTPTIMPEQHILLHLKINQDQVSSLNINGVPAITTQQLTTQVYMKDKSTVVLGGIFEQNRSEQRDAIPGLRHVPLVGRLFQHQEHINNRKQLLIFVTPVIIPR